MKLCQVIALTDGKKSRSQKTLTEIHHKLQKETLLEGISRTYRSIDDEGEPLPPESKRIQVRVRDELRRVSDTIVDLFDSVATQDIANTQARASVVVDGVTIVPDVPVTFLLFLEKQLADVHTLVSALPTLDPAEDWEYSDTAGCYASAPRETLRTKKVLRNHVLAEATKEHPAQVSAYNEDVTVGFWKTIKFSGAIPEEEKSAMLSRIRALQDAVKIARAEGNSLEITEERNRSRELAAYIFGNSASSVSSS